MNKEDRLSLIRDRLARTFSPDHLEVRDESDQHLGHAGHQGGGRHFAIQISATCFDGVSRVEIHRRIYAVFSDMMPSEIHALRICVK